jgi:hypothetical protein
MTIRRLVVTGAVVALSLGAAMSDWSAVDKLVSEQKFEEASSAVWIVPNTYPQGIRPTLRDAVSYFFVQLLADTGGWRPEQSAEVYRLDLRALVAGDPCGLSEWLWAHST